MLSCGEAGSCFTHGRHSRATDMLSVYLISCSLLHVARRLFKMFGVLPFLKVCDSSMSRCLSYEHQRNAQTQTHNHRVCSFVSMWASHTSKQFLYITHWCQYTRYVLYTRGRLNWTFFSNGGKLPQQKKLILNPLHRNTRKCHLHKCNLSNARDGVINAWEEKQLSASPSHCVYH